MRSWNAHVVCVGWLVVGFVPSMASARTDAAVCRDALDRVSATVAPKLLRIEQDCLLRQKRGKISSAARCTSDGPSVATIEDPATRRRAELLLDDARDLLVRKCSDYTIHLQPPDGLGYPTECPVAAGSPCAGPVFFPDELASCVLCAHVMAVNALTAVQSGVAPARCDRPYRLTVDVAPSWRSFSGIHWIVTYRLDTVAIPGHRTDSAVRAQLDLVPPGGLLSVFDDDVAGRLSVAYVAIAAFAAGPFATLEFCALEGQEPALDGFDCQVESAADEYAKDVEATCSVRPADD